MKLVQPENRNETIQEQMIRAEHAIHNRTSSKMPILRQFGEINSKLSEIRNVSSLQQSKTTKSSEWYGWRVLHIPYQWNDVLRVYGCVGVFTVQY